MYVLPPHLANGTRSYAELYSDILTTYRSSPLTSASSVTILVSTNVDALCAARMFSTLLHQDDIIHRIIPTPGYDELMEAAEDAVKNDELHTLIMLNVGGYLDLTARDWFGNAGSRLKIHVIDSIRPIHLANYYEAPDVFVWDDGSVEKAHEFRKSFEITFTAPELESDSEDESDLEDDSDLGSDDDDQVKHSEEDENENLTYVNKDLSSGKRRSMGDGIKPNKRRRTNRITRQEYKDHEETVKAYYKGGTTHGQSAAAVMYILATVLERVDNDLLWLAIMGLTYQYTTSRISRAYYDTQQAIYDDEVSRLNPIPPDGALTSINPDDASVRASDELRFMLFRHWTLYDAMLHSSYVASKLGIWKERGRKRLTGLLAKIGFSIGQTQQPYAHMDMDLKRDLVRKLNDIAPEYGLVELSYPSFMRCFGYRSQPLSAADAVEGISALLDAAGESQQTTAADGESVSKVPHITSRGELESKRSGWWIRNFWTAYDALNEQVDLHLDIGALREALRLSMALHRAIIRQGTSIIDKQDIKTMAGYRVVVLSQGPDLALFTHPSVLLRLALWLVDALRDHIPVMTNGYKTKRKSLPFVVACLNEVAETYMIVGFTAALEFDDVRKNEFTHTFINARRMCRAELRHTSFDATVVELPQKDLRIFLDALCEGP
ncbi:Cell division control protein 45 like protein [Termitomyces sp. J132]|nr:Cell division control protein 45 like protein [Termitomyces sp. J132]